MIGEALETAGEVDAGGLLADDADGDGAGAESAPPSPDCGAPICSQVAGIRSG